MFNLAGLFVPGRLLFACQVTTTTSNDFKLPTGRFNLKLKDTVFFLFEIARLKSEKGGFVAFKSRSCT
jgi:hypothetical protein